RAQRRADRTPGRGSHAAAGRDRVRRVSGTQAAHRRLRREVATRQLRVSGDAPSVRHRARARGARDRARARVLDSVWARRLRARRLPDRPRRHAVDSGDQCEPLPVAGRGLRGSARRGRHPVRGRGVVAPRRRRRAQQRPARMFVIRRVYDASTAANRERLAQVQAILRAQFPKLGEAQIAKLPDQLTNPLKYRFRAVVLVAEGARHGVRGFALMLHAPDLDFCYLDFLSAGHGQTGRGVGGALYQRVREDAAALGAVGLFFECLPDDPALSPDAKVRAENARRLTFYERFGARPIANNAYATPLKPGDTDPPYLVLDPLGHEKLPRREQARRIVRAILERKYGDRCPPGYVTQVVESFRDDPVRLRPPQYVTDDRPSDVRRPGRQRIALVVN